MATLTIPERFGPGVWLSDHITTANMATETSETEFIRSFNIRTANFPCGSCRKDAVGYLLEHDIEKYKNIFDERTGKRIGMFRYVWEMHNWVNRKIGKPEMEYKEAYDMYRDAEPCVTCGRD